MSEWFEGLASTHTRVWQTLGRGTADRRSPARHPVFATRGVSGGGEARVVVLRAVRQELAEVEVHTDARSQKVAELQADPVCSLLIWDPKASLQIRLRGRARLETGDEAVWASLYDGAKKVYGGSPAPGLAVDAPEQFQAAPDVAAFTRVIVGLTEIETLHLGTDMHRRARFSGPDWAGTWLAP